MNQETTPTNTDAIRLDDLRSLDALANEHKNVLSVTTLRWQLRQRHENGLANCCVNIGKRLMISKSRYEQWLATQTGAQA